MSTSFRTLTTKNGSLPCRGGGGAFRGRFMVRPLEEPVRTWTSRRGGGGVDEEGRRLRRPGQAGGNRPAYPGSTGEPGSRVASTFLMRATSADETGAAPVDGDMPPP